MFYLIPNSDIFHAVSSKHIQFFGHGANCWSIMGAGVAKLVAHRMPELKQTDAEFHLSPEKRIGRYSDVTLGNGVHAFNLYTQFYPGPNASTELIRSSLTLALESVAEEMVEDQVANFGIPALGCGIGGINFVDFGNVLFEVTELLAEDYPNVTVNVCVFTLPNQFVEETQQCVTNGWCEVKSL